MWVYQEIIVRTRPDFIIECGTYWGGSALFFASICDLINHGEVITIDVVDSSKRKAHDRITFIKGCSVKSAEEVCRRVNGARAMVILDSLHTKEHVLAEMEAYAEIVSLDCYMVVEDTNVDGPRDAVAQFLRQRPDFKPDNCSKYDMTFIEGGWLRRVRGMLTVKVTEVPA